MNLDAAGSNAFAHRTTPADLVWRTPPPDLVARQDELHVWCARLDPPESMVERHRRTLSSDEQARAAAFVFARDRRRFTVARAILRAILGRYLGVDAGRIGFCYGRRGKPALAGEGSLRFNIAHSEDVALYVVARGAEVGIDVERVRAISDLGGIAERVFSRRERATLRALPPADTLEAFFRCWTRKEAWIKATGVGLAQPLHESDVADAASPWTLLEPPPIETPPPPYVATVAAPGAGWRLAAWLWEPSAPGLSPSLD